MMMMRCEFKEEEGGEEEQRERERERERTTTKTTTTTTTTFFSSSATRSTQCSVGFSCHISKLERASGMEYTVTSEDIYLCKSPNFVLVIIYTRRGRHDAWKESKRRNKPLFIMCTSVRRDGPRCS